MKRRITHKQIKESGWLPFLEFMINSKVSPSDLKMAVLQFEAHNALMKVATSLEKSLYGLDKASKKKVIKMIGLSRQVNG
jgi:hypothetical protein